MSRKNNELENRMNRVQKNIPVKTLELFAGIEGDSTFKKFLETSTWYDITQFETNSF